jgi:hypothetical protein
MLADVEAIAEQVFTGPGRPDPSRDPGRTGRRRPGDGHRPGRSAAGHAAGDRQAPALMAEAGLVTAEPGERRRVRYRLRSAPMQVAQQFLAGAGS